MFGSVVRQVRWPRNSASNASARTEPVWNIGGDNPTAIDEALDMIFRGNDFSAEGCQLAAIVEQRKPAAAPATAPATPLTTPGSALEAMELLDEAAEEYPDEDDEGC
ncbi:MAG: hypothetical protein IMF08_03515 [Proteobacteria bacterium]|nr:hypothetical protein [Pseudomonadota bacterium]